MAAEDSDDSFNYANQIRDADSESLRRLCFSAGLSRSGNAPAKRNRLLSYAAGSARRQRIHWLELFLVAEQAGFDPSGSGPFDFAKLDDDNADLLSDFFDNVHVSGTTATEFSRCLPHRLLPDCERDGDDFSVPDSFLWPSKRAMLAFLSDEDSPSSSASSAGSAATTDIRLRLDQMPEQIMAKMVKDISENRLGVTGDSSAALLRRTHAFHISPDKFVLYDQLVGAGQSGRLALCNAPPNDAVPFSSDLMHKLCFESLLNSTDVKRISRRYLMPEELYASAPSVDLPEVISQMGGKQGKSFQEFEKCRIRQEAALQKTQALFSIVAHASNTLFSLDSCIANIDAHNDDADSADVDAFEGNSVTLGAVQWRHLCTAIDDVNKVLYAASDCIHIAAVDLSELERQKDDHVVRAVSKDPDYTSLRPKANPTKNTKDVSGLLDIARRLRVSRKEQLQLDPSSRPRSQSRDRDPPRSNPRNNPRKPGNRGNPRPNTPDKPRPESVDRRKAQSEADKARDAGKGAGYKGKDTKGATSKN